MCRRNDIPQHTAPLYKKPLFLRAFLRSLRYHTQRPSREPSDVVVFNFRPPPLLSLRRCSSLFFILWHILHSNCRFETYPPPPCDLGILWSISKPSELPHDTHLPPRYTLAISFQDDSGIVSLPYLRRYLFLLSFSLHFAEQYIALRFKLSLLISPRHLLHFTLLCGVIVPRVNLGD